jgi:DnaK suppressor protein
MRTQDYKQLLTNKLRDIRSSRVSPSDIAIERNAEMMDDIQRTGDRELALTERSQAWKTSQGVSAALGRIADGTYGVCMDCGEPINERRLIALPWAEHCIVCQLRQETEPELAAAA